MFKNIDNINKLPANVLDEAYKFYYEQWEEIQKLRDFKLELVEKTLKEAMKDVMAILLHGVLK